MKEASDLNLAAAGRSESADRDRLVNLLLAADRKRRALHSIAPRVNPDAPIPLSYAQERLWFLEQVGLAGAAYNVLLALRLTGELVEGALERSFAELLRRHETLRTHFELREGVPHQVIDPPSAFPLHRVDLSRADDAGPREQQFRELIQSERTQQFDLQAGPILRAVLARLGNDEHALIVTIHHIACDGWSLGILIRELSTLYSAEVRGDASDLAALPVQYADYAVWQRQWLQGSVWREQMQYWRQRLLNAPQQLDLPTDRPRPAIESFRGGESRFTLPASLCAALKELAVREGATLFMVVLAAYQILLSRWSGQQDVVVGSPIAARRHREIEGLIGFFVNTLALRVEIDADLTFRQLLERVKETTLGAYAHQDLPFEALVKELRPERNLSRQPLFQVMLALQNFPNEQLQLPGLRWSWREAERATTHFDLTLYLAEDASGGLSGLFEYASDLFDPITIERLTGHFATLLQAIVANADGAVGQLPLLTEAEEQQLLLQSTGTAMDFREQVLIHELFEEQAARTPRALAATYRDQSITYAQLNSRANQLARFLREQGITHDALVAICVERSLEMVTALLGILKAGAAYLPLDPNYPMERLQYMLQDASPHLVLTQAKLCGAVPPSQARVVTLDEIADHLAGYSEENIEQAPAATGRLLYVIYTSGSTGRPKGTAMPLLHGQLARLA